jgi:hypothetical protein
MMEQICCPETSVASLDKATEIHKDSPDCKQLTRLFVADRPCLHDHLVSKAVSGNIEEFSHDLV